MSRESIGIGVIGMGWMGVAHSRSYRNVLERFPDLQLQPGLIACAAPGVECTIWNAMKFNGR